MNKNNQQLKAEELFLKSLKTHIRYVQIASTELNKILKPDERISYNEMLRHDNSKFSDMEFPHYARNFFGSKDDKEGFNNAWMHHLKNNTHHWEHWLQDFEVLGTEHLCNPLPMPLEQVSIMVADLLAAERQYCSSWNFINKAETVDNLSWLNANLGGHTPKVIIHKDTRNQLDSILSKIGYTKILDTNPRYIMVNPEFTNKLRIAELGFKLLV